MEGDSLLDWTYPAIIKAFRTAGYDEDKVKFQVSAYGGSNVHEYVLWFHAPLDHTLTPITELQYQLDTFHPDVVFASWGMAKLDSLYDAGLGWLMPWVVSKDMQTMKTMVEASGAKLYWATMPVRGATDDPALNDYVNNTVNGLIHNLGVPLVDWRAAVAPEDGDVYAEFLKLHEDETVHPIRWWDGIHFADAGIARVAQQTLHDLAPVACKPVTEPATP